MVVGSSEMVLRSGMPSDAAGPVADTVTPTFTSAQAAVENPATAAHSNASFFNCMGSLPGEWMVGMRRRLRA